MGAIDSNGIYRHDETDVQPTFSDLIDLLADSVSNKVATMVSQQLAGDADLDTRIDALEGDAGAWTAYVPALGSGWTLGTGTLVSRQRTQGKTVHVRHVLTFSASTVLASANSGFGHPYTLPAPAAVTNAVFNGAASFYDSSANVTYHGWVGSSTAATQAFAQFPTAGSTTTTRMSATAPVAAGPGDVLSIAYSYERA
ncbi:hypothetical protein CWIS_09755 [Cellulomonas sp. A375-1]|uniref:hypothetical protein n=1 Tax=Cellulomonas sp. A375-1 TaxID=1672219 RepID=UPI0006526880|nr:hypothetical protein [Cellulomonas sp. A375-1]KMM45615.1 hypothetical protein CWIS_09755 [Cellulomonas sp. A375-1]